MRCLVTGTSGFIGGTVARGLHSLGHEVLGVDRVVAEGLPFSTATLDLCSSPADTLVGNFEPEAVVHAAGPASVAFSIEEPGTEFRYAALPWVTVLEAVRRRARNARVVLISSAAAYGQPVDLPITERTNDQPLSPYGFHRHLCEVLAQSYTANYGLEICALRLFSTFGPSQNRLLVWELFSQALADCPTLTLRGTGREMRDYVYESDLPYIVEAVVRHATCYSRINVASGRSITTRDLAQAIADACNVDKPVECQGQSRGGDPERWQVDNRLLLEVLSPRALTSLEVGLKSCAEQWEALLKAK